MNRPPLRLQTTTLWYYPSQQIPGEVVGDPRFEGATPAYVIWNLLERYTRAEDLVVDPFAGGGTSLDVARQMGRRALGYDVHPTRDDVFRADARKLPLEDAKADFVFMDPPYSTHLEYGDDPRDIGKLDAMAGDDYYLAMDQVFAEAHRVLRERRFVAVYVSDSFKKGKPFAALGCELYALLRKRFVPTDHVAVVRGNRTLEKPNFHRAAAEGNYFLRGFNHLLIFKKQSGG